MRRIRRLISVLVCVMLLFCILSGCTNSSKTAVTDTLTGELNQMKKLDSKTIQEYVSFKELFPNNQNDTDLSSLAEEVFTLYFDQFDYSVENVNVDSDSTEASATVLIKTIDARSLAQDYARAQLEISISDASGSSPSASNSQNSLKQCYQVLYDLLTDPERSYETAETSCKVRLTRKDKDSSWVLVKDSSLQNALTGGLINNLSDSDILSPEATLEIYLSTIKNMSRAEKSSYLGLNAALNSSDANHDSIGNAILDQIDALFDYQVASSQKDGYTATVTAAITTFDSDAILKSYSDQLQAYMDTSEAVIDGAQKRYEKATSLLVSAIKDNTGTRTNDCTFSMTNDGNSWKLLNGGTDIGNAIFGSLAATVPQDETDIYEITDAASDASSDDSYSDTTYDDASYSDDYYSDEAE